MNRALSLLGRSSIGGEAARRWAIAVLGACVGLAASAATEGDEVQACGFVGAHVVPAIAVEQVLMIFDAKRQKEHFIREVRFKGASEAFGFVVPTPSRPEVAKTEQPPFNRLLADYRFQAYEQKAVSHFSTALSLGLIAMLGGGAGQGFGGGHGRSGAGVDVLSVQRVGKFTAFVLHATEKDALGSWLEQNGFTASVSTKPWLAHYVERGFFFTAFRYDAPKDKKQDELVSEVVRLSFDTPVPYYPYLEPTAAPGEQRERTERLLRLWFVSEQPMRPIALHRDATDELQYKRPWTEGMRTEATRKDLEALPDLDALLPEAPNLVVQAFEDAKVSRRGWGDVLLAPATAAPLDEAARKARAHLLPLLLPEASK